MKKSVLLVAFVLLISGLGYASGNKQTQVKENAFIKGFELALLTQKQTVSKSEQFNLARYQEEITKQLKIKHPRATKVLNLGQLPAEFDAGKKDAASGAEHYLWKVGEGDLKSFYYDVQISPVLRATSDVIPSHVSGVAILIKEIKPADLADKLRALKK